MVYVISVDGKPLMPTNRHGKVKKWLRDGRAKVVQREPFTIQFLLKTETEITQPITLGVDAGSKVIGLSATTEKRELLKGEYELRNDISDKLTSRRILRRARRSRIRYRKARFNNRANARRKGRLVPSIEHKINSHLKIVADLHKILPITKVIVEVASFDVQKIKNPDIHGKQYQEGPQKGFWNVREHVLFRDNHECQNCHGKSGDEVLNVHHIRQRKDGGSNAPDNLIALCRTCHQDFHRGKIELNLKKPKSFKDSAFMGIMRKTFCERLTNTYPDVEVTYGYETKAKRIELGLDKTHYNDAYCIANNLSAKMLEHYYYFKKIRCHNRQLYKCTLQKGNKLLRNQTPYTVMGFRLYDKVKHQNKEYFITGRRASGTFAVRDLAGNKPTKSGNITYRKLEFLEPRRTVIVEKRISQQAKLTIDKESRRENCESKIC